MKFRNFFTGLVLASTVAFSTQTQAYDAVIDDTPSGEAMAFDLFIARPLGVVGTVAGVVVYVVALPINILSFNLVSPFKRLVLEPFEWTFVRELGAID